MSAHAISGACQKMSVDTADDIHGNGLKMCSLKWIN